MSEYVWGYIFRVYCVDEMTVGKTTIGIANFQQSTDVQLADLKLYKSR